MASSPTHFTIPPSLEKYTVPLSAYRKQHPEIDRLVVSALIIFPPALTSTQSTGSPGTTSSSTTNTSTPPKLPSPRLLLLQRTSTDSYPNKWEVPGGSCELSDPTILHSLAREVLEETGLHVTRIIREVGTGVHFQTGNPRSNRGVKNWLKLSFEVEVQEMTSGPALDLASEKMESDSTAESILNGYLSGIRVVLAEHRAYVWATAEQIQARSVKSTRLSFVSQDGIDVMIQGLRPMGTDEMA